MVFSANYFVADYGFNKIMTVRRQLDGHFDFPALELADAVRAILSRNPSYRSTAEDDPGKVFTSLVRPHRWLPGTWLTISLEPYDAGTKVLFKTTSQWFVFWDILNTCNQHIWRALKELRQEVRQK